jgi:hypothetical protein
MATPAVEPLAGEAATGYHVVEGKVVVVTASGESPLLIPEPVFGLYHAGEELYVARGAAGVSIYDVSAPLAPQLGRDVPTPGASATGFALIDGQVWVTTVARAAMPLEQGVSAPSSLATPAGVPATGVGALRGPSPTRVVGLWVVTPGSVELDAGKKDGVRVGDRFAIYRSTSVDGPRAEGFQGEELVAMSEVVAVKEDRARAELSRNAVVLEGDTARLARDDQTESNAYPVRVAHLGEVGGVLRPIINAGSPLGVGVLAEASASYWGKGYFVDVMLQPVGLGWTEDGNVVSAAALIDLGYDGRAFAVGLGAGMSWVNGDADYMLASFKGTGAEDAAEQGQVDTVERQETHSAFTLAQLVRLGARDGLNLSLRNLLILHHDQELDENGFIYGGTLGKLSVPLDRRSDIFLEGGGGVMGYWLVGAGVGTWIVGNGSPGSWKLSISAGAAGIWGSREVTETTTFPGQAPSSSTYTEQIDIDGPMVSAGLMRRFAW